MYISELRGMHLAGALNDIQDLGTIHCIFTKCNNSNVAFALGLNWWLVNR